jgi:hypothetical protein
MPSKVLTRRSLLRSTLGASAALALSPFLPVLEAEAQQLPVRKRLVLVFWSGGTTVGPNWPTGTEKDFKFSPMMTSLEPYKSKLVVFKNMRRHNDYSQGGHQAGTGGTWTSARMLAKEGPKPWTSGPSLDRFIIDKVPQPTPFPTIDLDCQSQDPENLRSKTLFDLQGRPIQGEQDPSRAFDRIFTDGVVSVGTDPKLAERLRAERRSILDLVRGDLTSLQSRMSGQDRIKMDQHLEALRATEQRLSPGSMSPGTVMLPTKDQFPKMDYLANDNFPQIAKLHMDLLVASLASDRSRIISLQFSQGNGDIRYRWVGVEDEHHALTHKAENDPRLDRIHTYYYEQFAYLLGKMNAISEGNGTLLDNSVVCIANELISGFTHSSDPWPIIMAGSGGGYFKTGRFIAYPEIPTDADGGKSDNTVAPNHSQFLVSMANYMGAQTDRVGDPTMGPSGQLPGLL